MNDGALGQEAERYERWAAEIGKCTGDDVVIDDIVTVDGLRTETRQGAYDVALRAHRLAKLLVENGQYDDATALYERALALRSELLEKEYADLAKTAHNLALLYERVGRGEDADSLWARIGSVLGSSPEGLVTQTRSDP